MGVAWESVMSGTVILIVCITPALHVMNANMGHVVDVKTLRQNVTNFDGVTGGTRMNDYEETFKISNLEINKQVLQHTKKQQLKEGWKILKRHGLTEDEAVMYNRKEDLYYSYDYSKDISLSWSIILQNRIDLRFDLNEKGTCTAVSPDGLGYYDKNPLRAAMIVFLMMKDTDK